jgi:acetyltransferase
MVRFSFLVAEQHWIREIDINPLLASSKMILALDARVVLHGLEIEEKNLPQLAIRPYPIQYIEPWNLKDDTFVNIRPVRPEDEPLMAEFHAGLSEHSVYMRYFHALQLSQRVAHERLTRICFIDYDREMVLVAVKREPERQIVGVGRLSKIYGSDEAEFAILIDDQFQGQGLGTELLRRLVKVAEDERDIGRVMAYMLPENLGMRRISEKLSFDLKFEDRMVRAEKKIRELAP